MDQQCGAIESDWIAVFSQIFARHLLPEGLQLLAYELSLAGLGSGVTNNIALDCTWAFSGHRVKTTFKRGFSWRFANKPSIPLNMNIILVPEGIRKGRTASFTQRQILVMGLVALVIMPVLLSTVTYRIVDMLGHGASQADLDRIAQQQAQLTAQRAAIERTKRHTETHLNALAQRLGQLQAQVMRLDALGGRLTNMAGIDPKEFDFARKPGMGGPAEPTAVAAQADLMKMLNTLDSQVAQQSEQLHALQSVLINNNTYSAVTPAGWPVKGGWLSSHFGLRADPFNGRTSMHRGVDIASPLKSNIYAMGEGVVTYAGPRHGYGMMVEINHGRGYSTRYAHASEVLVSLGDRVSRGQPVALVGMSGRSTGPHLHFEVLKRGRQIDPSAYLNNHATTTAHKSTKVAHDPS